MKLKKDYDKENDIFYINFGGEVKHSREVLDGRLILDFNNKGEVVGFELFGFEEELEKSDKEVERILNKGEQDD